MNINSAFFTPLKLLRKTRNAFSADTIIEISKNKSYDKHMLNHIYSSLNIRVIPFMLLIMGFILGIIVIGFRFHKNPNLPATFFSFIPPLLILFSLLITSLVINSRTNKFINKISANVDHAAIAYRYLLTKKRNCIYLMLLSAFLSHSLCNSEHWITLLSLLLTTAFYACIPLYKIQLRMMKLQSTSNPLAIFNIINPQYFNRFQRNSALYPTSEADAERIIQ